MGIWQTPVLSRGVKQLDGDLKGFLRSVEENSNLGVQTSVMGWSIFSAEWVFKSHRAVGVPRMGPWMSWHGLDQCGDPKSQGKVGSG